MQIEGEQLLPLATEGFELPEAGFGLVDRKACVKSGDQQLFGAVARRQQRAGQSTAGLRRNLARRREDSPV